MSREIDEIVDRLQGALDECNDRIEVAIVVAAVTQFAAGVLAASGLRPGITRDQQLALFSKHVRLLVAIADGDTAAVQRLEALAQGPETETSH